MFWVGIPFGLRRLFVFLFLLFICLDSSYVQIVYAQENTRNASLAIEPDSGFIGDEFSVACSSPPLRPGVRLDIRWSALEGNNTNPVLLGECHSVEAGFPGMECSPEVHVKVPYSDGVTDFAVSTLRYHARTSPVRIECQPGNGQTLEVTPSLALVPVIENLHIICNDRQSELVWQLRGEADYFEVDAGTGTWQRVNEAAFPITPQFNNPQTFRVRAVNDHGEGPPAEISSGLAGLQARHSSMLAMVVDAAFVCSKEQAVPASASIYRIFSPTSHLHYVFR